MGNPWSVVTRLEMKYLDRWPMVMFFRSMMLGACALLLFTVSTLILLISPSKRPTTVAQDLLPPDLHVMYMDSLGVVREQCAAFQPASGSCNVEKLPSSSPHTAKMWSVVELAHLQGCRSFQLSMTDISKSNYIACRGYAEPTVSLTIMWTGLGAFALVALGTITGAMIRNRPLLPTYSPHIWVAPHASLAFILSVAPLVLSLALFNALTNREGNPKLLVPTAHLIALILILISTIVAFLAADLKTYLADRLYVLGVVFIFVIAVVTLILILMVSAGLSRFADGIWIAVIDAVLVVSSVAVASRIRMKAPLVRQGLASCGRYMVRVFKLLPFVALSSITLVLDVVVGGSLHGVSFLSATYGLLILNVLMSKLLEKALIY